MNSLLMTPGAWLCASVVKAKAVINEVEDSLLNRRIGLLLSIFLVQDFPYFPSAP
jgi:hypothetical protein